LLFGENSTNLKKLIERWKRKKTKKVKRTAERELNKAKAKGMPTFQRIFLSGLRPKNRSDTRLEKYKRRKHAKTEKRVILLLAFTFILTLVALFMKNILHL